MRDPGRLVDVSCVAHVHTTYSDGTATVPELLAAAAEAGVDAVLPTDHDTLVTAAGASRFEIRAAVRGGAVPGRSVPESVTPARAGSSRRSDVTIEEDDP